jgi:RHS repeat-associated protein
MDNKPFGESTVQQDPDGDGKTVAFNLRFPGQYFDQETELNYNYFRDYDPMTGRYIESDPIGQASDFSDP